MRRRLMIGLGLLVASAPFAPAFSQENQTTDNAVRFLAQVLSGVHETIDTPRTRTFLVTGLQSSLPPKNFCRIVFNVTDEGTGEQYSDLIYFDVMVDVKQRGSQVVVANGFKMEAVRGTTIYEMESADLAARTVYAMQFLKQKCDKTAGTGF